MRLHQHFFGYGSPSLKTLLGKFILPRNGFIVNTAEGENDGAQDTGSIFPGGAMQE